MFTNRIRLPFYLKHPQFPTEAIRFRLADGTSKTLAVTIRKVYDLETDYMTDDQHQKLVIALNHDSVSIEGERYFGSVAMDADYDLPAVDFLDYPLRKATTKVQVTPFDATNSNCQTCEQASQLSLVDDDIGEIAEGATDTVNTYTNDSICCFPPAAEIVSFNAGYLASATIDSVTGIASLTAKNPAATIGNTVLATYRVTCPDGSYDEADIYGSIAGTLPGCGEPTGLNVVLSDPPAPYTATITWVAPAAAPSFGYEWIMYVDGVVVDSGEMLAGVVILVRTDLLPSTTYTFSIRSQCGAEDYSPYTNIDFTTPSGTIESCGRFDVIGDDGTEQLNLHNYSYMDCNGVIQNATIRNFNQREICMLMDEFNQPVYFVSAGGAVTASYLEPC